MSFSLASPLAKFLNGLEILLGKAQVRHIGCTFIYLFLEQAL